jgi:methionyl aminopeptidase
MKKSTIVYYKTQEEIEIIRQNCLLVSKTLALVASHLKPGVSPKELDRKAEEFIRDHKAVPGFKGYRGFPATLCFSANDVVVHGIPYEVEVKEGDIISVDCGVAADGYFGDAAYTFLVGDVDSEIRELCKVTKDSLYKGIDAARVGGRIGDVGFAVQQLAEKEHGYGVVRELVGHGLGKNLHEAPDVPNFGKRGKGMMIKEGLVIAIEPMVNLGTKDVKQLRDGWTIVSKDRKASAHYEHTIAVLDSGPDILSDHTFLEAEIKKNPNLSEV